MHQEKVYIIFNLAVSIAFFSVSNSMAQTPKTNYPFKFTDKAKEVGLMPAITNIKGHGAGWGDYNGDGYLDLFAGVFNTRYNSPFGDSRFGNKSMLFRQENGKFVLDQQKDLDIYRQTTGVAFVDLDNDGDLQRFKYS